RQRGGQRARAIARPRTSRGVQIDKQNQTAVRRDRRAGEKLYAAKIFTEALDHDFVLAENFLDNQTDLAVVRVCHNHAEVAIDRFQRWQAEMRIEPNYFSNNIANLGQ